VKKLVRAGWTNERAVAEHADTVAADAGGIDIALNAVSFPHMQGTPLADLTFEEVMQPIDAFVRTNLMTAMAVARHMAARGSGTILTVSTAGSRVMPPGVLGSGTACVAIEAMTHRLAVEFGQSGVRAPRARTCRYVRAGPLGPGDVSGASCSTATASADRQGCPQPNTA
jgi:NAD(P)-dependent dehydrogenase (short-subunit alcohol dehydrogenase family)